MNHPGYYAFHTTARTLFEMGKEKDSWFYLFLAYADHAESKSYKSADSPKQREVQRLWMKRGMLERTQANLREASRQIIPLEDQITLTNAMHVVHRLIQQNKQDFNTIKDRIPNDKDRPNPPHRNA